MPQTQYIVRFRDAKGNLGPVMTPPVDKEFASRVAARKITEMSADFRRSCTYVVTEYSAPTSPRRPRARFYVVNLIPPIGHERYVVSGVAKPVSTVGSVIYGPFRTKAGALYFEANRNCTSVAEAERAAKLPTYETATRAQEAGLAVGWQANDSRYSSDPNDNGADYDSLLDNAPEDALDMSFYGYECGNVEGFPLPVDGAGNPMVS